MNKLTNEQLIAITKEIPHQYNRALYNQAQRRINAACEELLIRKGMAKAR